MLPHFGQANVCHQSLKTNYLLAIQKLANFDRESLKLIQVNLKMSLTPSSKLSLARTCEHVAKLIVRMFSYVAKLY